MANTNSETQIKGTVSNHCYTSMKSRTCNLNFSWTIDKYSVLSSVHSVPTLKSAAFSAVDDDDTKWYLTHEPGDTCVYLYLDNDVLGTLVLVSGNAKFYVMESGGKMEEFLEEDFCDFDFDSTSTDEDDEYVGYGSFRDIEESLHEDKLTIRCQVTYTKHSDMGTTSTSLVSTPIKIPESNHSLDFEKILNDEYFSDVTISVEGKNYPGHKAILSAHSPVFNTMFRSDMQENQRNHIVITDIDQKTFEEMMQYIYTGKVKNIEESAFELLPVADKYDLKDLRIMCENVLFRKLSTDNVARILILADMHHAENLKARALRFIKMNHSKCKDFKETEVWNILTTSRPHLMNDLMKIFFDE